MGIKTAEEIAAVRVIYNSGDERVVRRQLLKDVHLAYMDARKNKLGTLDEKRFDVRAEENLQILVDDILAGTYTPSRSKVFIIRDPVQYWDRQFITDSYSCRRATRWWVWVVLGCE